MGGYINKTMLMGNLGADPETRYTGSGTAITELRIATTSTWRDKQSGERQERTEWHRVVFFGKLAEVCGEYLHKGDKVYVEGENRTEEYTDKDGVKRWATKVYGQEMQMVITKGDEQGERGGGQRNNSQRGERQYGSRPPLSQQETVPEQAGFDDDAIPF